MIRFPNWHDSHEIFPVLSIFDNSISKVHPMIYFNRDAKYVYYIVVGDFNSISIHTRGGWGLNDTKDIFEITYKKYIENLKPGEYLVDFKNAILNNLATPEILYKKTKNIEKFFSEDLWVKYLDEEHEKIIVYSNKTNKFYWLGYTGNKGISDTVYLHGISGKHILPDSNKQTDFGKKLTLLLLSKLYIKDVYRIPKILDDKFVFTSTITNPDEYIYLIGDLDLKNAISNIEELDAVELKKKKVETCEIDSIDIDKTTSIIRFNTNGTVTEIKKLSVPQDKIKLSKFISPYVRGFDAGIKCPAEIAIDFDFKDARYNIKKAIYLGNLEFVLKMEKPEIADKIGLEEFFHKDFTLYFLDELSEKTQKEMNALDFILEKKLLTLSDINN